MEREREKRTIQNGERKKDIKNGERKKDHKENKMAINNKGKVPVSRSICIVFRLTIPDSVEISPLIASSFYPSFPLTCSASLPTFSLNHHFPSILLYHHV